MTPRLLVLMALQCCGSVAEADEYVYVSIVPDTMKPSTAATRWADTLNYRLHEPSQPHTCKHTFLQRRKKTGGSNPEALAM